MWPYITALILALVLLSLVVYYARRNGQQAARLEALKREVKERQRAQTIIDTVNRTDSNRVRDKLQQTK